MNPDCPLGEAIARAEWTTGLGVSGHLEEPKKGWQRIFDRDELRQLAHLIAEAGGEFQSTRDAAGNELENLQIRLEHARSVAAKLKIDTSGVRIPDLRRTLGSWQAKIGASLAIIGKSLNHKNTATTAIYARLDLDPVRASMERATAAMLTAAGLKKPAEVVKLKKSA